MEGKNVPDGGVGSVTEELRYPCPIICTVVFFHKIFKKVLKCHAIKFKARKCCLTAEEKRRIRVCDQTSLWPGGVSFLWLGRCQEGGDSGRLRGGLWTGVVRGQQEGQTNPGKALAVLVPFTFLLPLDPPSSPMLQKVRHREMWLLAQGCSGRRWQLSLRAPDPGLHLPFTWMCCRPSFVSEAACPCVSDLSDLRLTVPNGSFPGGCFHVLCGGYRLKSLLPCVAGKPLGELPAVPHPAGRDPDTSSFEV